jgi:iron complex outermembrane recepter protein
MQLCDARATRAGFATATTYIRTGALAALLLGVSSVAHAQSSPEAQAANAAAGGEGLEDIVVTAQRRTQNLQDVPIATTALASEALARSNVASTAELQQLTPNLQVNGSFELLPKITIRGVGTNDFAANMAAAVATNVDEVYIGLATGQTLQLYDLDRIEVLRGPQGTLYGKNTTGGAINYLTKRPDTSHTSGMISATVGRFNRVDIEGNINVPLADNLAARVSVMSRDRDGFWQNDFDGSKGRYLDSRGARLQFLYEPTDKVEVLLKGHIGKVNTDSTRRQPIGVLDPNVPGLQLIGGVDVAGYRGTTEPNRGEQDPNTYEWAEEQGLMGRVNVDLGFADLVSISAYGKVERAALDDADGGRYKILNHFYGNTSDFLSQELRLGNSSDKFTWIVGAHAYREKHDVDVILGFFECTLVPGECTIRPQVAPNPVPPGRIAVGGYAPGNVFPGGPLAGVPIASKVDLHYDQTNTSYAGFGEVTYHLNDQFSITGGLRYTWERKEIDAISVSSLIARPTTPSPFFPGYGLFDGSKSWDNLSGRVILEYKPNNDALFYVNAGTGFRSGNWNGIGFNSRATIETPVDPEKLKSVEIGAKTEWFDRRLRANFAAFYSDYDDLQVAVFINSASVLANAAAAEIYGGEAELTAALAEGLQGRFTAGYTNAKYKSFNDGRGNDLSGNTLVNAPKWTMSASLDYERPISDAWTFGFGADVRYQSKVYFTVFNFDHLGQKAYAVTDLRAELSNKDEGLRFAAFVENVFDKGYRVDGNQIRAPFGMDIVSWGRPLMWGFSASKSF